MFLQPALLMLYTIGFFLGYQTDDGTSTVEGQYRLFKGEDWEYPVKIRLGAFNSSYLDLVASSLSERYITVLPLSNATSSEDVVGMCKGAIGDSASEEVCAFLSSESGYELYYGGEEAAFPFQGALAGAQHAMNAAILNAANVDEVYPAVQIQRTPQLLTSETVKPVLAVVLVPATMYVLAGLLASMFVSGIVINEKVSVFDAHMPHVSAGPSGRAPTDNAGHYTSRTAAERHFQVLHPRGSQVTDVPSPAVRVLHPERSLFRRAANAGVRLLQAHAHVERRSDLRFHPVGTRPDVRLPGPW